MGQRFESSSGRQPMMLLMDYDFSLIFCDIKNTDDEYRLYFKLRNNSISNKWFLSLIEAIDNSWQIQNDRFYNFKNSYWSKEKIIKELNDCISICNNEHPGLIDFKIGKDLTQEDNNKLHVYFEKYRGAILDPHPYFVNGSYQYKKAMEDMNILIHRWESLEESEKHEIPARRMVFNFSKNNRRLLEDNDYLHFDYPPTFGELTISYCEVGKPLYDVYEDNDEHVGEENIRPLRYYSADFNLFFYCHTNFDDKEKWKNKFNSWFDDKSNYLNSLGFTKGDPKNALGLITVADIINDENRLYIIENIETRQFLKRIEIK